MSLSTAVRRARAREDRKRVSFLHKGSAGSYPIPLAAQSAGTQALFAYAAPLLTALDEGTLFVVDEIDASLHPVLTARLIGLFQSPAANPRGAQLLLTTHDVTLLGRSGGEDILKRDQIWFADKDDSGATEIFALSEFKPRKDENRERRYLGGSYGAVPFISEERLAEIATSGRGAGNDGA
jgi:AAA15 family ATPase/GTPase